MDENEIYDRIAKLTDVIADNMIGPFVAGIIIRRHIHPDTIFKYVVAGYDALECRETK